MQTVIKFGFVLVNITAITIAVVFIGMAKDSVRSQDGGVKTVIRTSHGMKKEEKKSDKVTLSISLDPSFSDR